ncbi:MAG TPA: hypothetical protein VGE67_04845 [Haloferula sp.]
MEPFIFFLFLIGFVVTIRLVAGSFDGERVEAYVRNMGGELLDKSWDPFGPGWFGEKNSRIYEIVYRDRSGRVHRAHVKTSMMSGVYLTNDHIIEDRRPESIEVEKARLKARLAELERQSR